MDGYKTGPSTSFFVSIGLGVVLILSLTFGIWAFIGMQENKSNLDEKIEAASEVAVDEAEEAKEAEFTERLKDPFLNYTGSATFGSLSFDYPKSWSVYLNEEANGKTILDFYAHPRFVPANDETSYAYRVQILADSYTNIVEKLETEAKIGRVSIEAFRAEKVDSEPGILVRGEIAKGKQGIKVVLPLRDKSIVFWTESTDYAEDFNKILKTITFVP